MMQYTVWYIHRRRSSDASPIHWQYGALARLKKGETIDKLLHGGYSTISLGYAGLYECVMAMTGKSHTDPDGEPFALKVMQYMNDKCAAWKAAEDIDYSLYGTPIESTTYKFAKCLQKRFGVIEGITDKGYITNSYHVHVTEHINAFDKLRFESQFQKLSPGGAISYIEVANLSDNIPAVLTVLKYTLFDANDLYSIVPFNQKRSYDMVEVLARLFDGSEFMEYKHGYGPEMITGLAKIDGLLVGVVANYQGMLMNYPEYKMATYGQAMGVEMCLASVPLNMSKSRLQWDFSVGSI